MGANHRRSLIVSAAVALCLAVSPVPTSAYATDGVAVQAESHTYGEGTAGFFASIGEDYAAGIVTDLSGVSGSSARKYFADEYADREEETSTFNLDAMLTSLDIIDRCNALRQQNGLDELLVDPYLMAMSQVSTAWAEHRQTDSAVSSNSHAVSRENSLAENLAWNYSGVIDAFVQWYDDEYQYWYTETPQAVRDALNSYIAQHGFNNGVYFFSQNASYSSYYQNAGHHFNIINPQYKVAGAGYSTGESGKWNTFEQTFASGKSSHAKRTYTVSEFRGLLESYLDEVGEPESPAAQRWDIMLRQPSVGGTISSSAERTPAGDMVTITVTPTDGYTVSQVTVSTIATQESVAVTKTSDTTWTFTMPDGAVNVYATFSAAPTYHVTANQPEHAVVYLGSEPYEAGETAYYMIAPDEGYAVSTISAVDATGRDVALDGPLAMPDGLRYTFTMPASNVTITATVEQAKTARPIAVVEHHGSVLVPSEAEPGISVNFHVSPEVGYTFEGGSVTVTTAQGEPVSVAETSENSYTFTMPDDAVTVTATAVEESGVDVTSMFSDVVPGEWYIEGVTWVVEHGYMSGHANSDRFGPTENLSRAQMAQILYNAAGKPAVSTDDIASFTDCNAAEWYAPAVSWAVQEGIFSGYGDGRFGPNDNITREQIAVVLWRREGGPTGSEAYRAFPDAWKTHDWACAAVSWAVDAGIISGYDNTGELGPTNYLKRAEAAAIMMRYFS